MTVNTMVEQESRAKKSQVQRKKNAQRARKKSEKSKKIDGIDVALHSKIVKRVGHPRNRKRRINVRLAYKMHEAGWSYPQIGAYFKVSGCTVRRRLREAGLR